MTFFFQDIRFGFRMLKNKISFTLVAVLTLAIGIGATTTIFSVLKALVLDPFSYPDQDKIAFVWSNDGQPLSVPDFVDIQKENTSFSSLGVYNPASFNLSGNPPESVRGFTCTEGVLRSMGVQPMLGRWLVESDQLPGAEPVAVLSHALWVRKWNADLQIIGRTIRLNDSPYRVVGVMPPDFEFFSPWNQTAESELWVPLDISQDHNRDWHWLLCIGRLKDGVLLQTADAEVKTIGARLAQAYPDSNLRKPFLIRSLLKEGTKNYSSKLWILMGAVVLVLLVACTNVASMLLAWGANRQSEFSIRIALGATRGNILRLLLSEYVLLGFFGCALGILFSLWGVTAIQSLVPASAFRRAAMQIDLPVLFFSGGLALLTILLFGIPPALTAVRTSLQENMKQSGKSHTGSRQRHRYLQGLVAAQIALALVLANGAALLSTSYLNILQANQKMDTEYILSSSIRLQGDHYKEKTERKLFLDQLIRRVTNLPGVISAGFADPLPLEGGSNCTILVDDEVFDSQIQRLESETATISSDFFGAMNLRLYQGRTLTPEDSQGEVIGVVINRTFADKFWPGENPLGRKIRGNAPTPWFSAQVVGVVEGIRQWGADAPVVPQIYFPYEYSFPNNVSLVVRTQSDAHQFTPLLRQELAALDSNLPLANIRTMKEILNDSMHARRFLSQLVNFFMTAALLLAAVGIYGTLSYQVLQRTREIGLRITFGANSRNIIIFVFHQVGGWVILGLTAGLGMTVCLSLLFRSFVYDISPLHPQSLIWGIGLAGGVACFACLLPARRAVKVNPMTALRGE